MSDLNQVDIPGSSDPAGQTVTDRLSRYKVNAERHDLALAWMAAEILGAIAITVTPQSVGAWRMLAPLSFMAAYLVFSLTRSRYNTARVADSVYFMGFWWTLWALIDVLILHGDKDPLTAAKLYQTFGYALVTTAAGMFVRLAMLQFYRTLDDQEEQAVDQIDEHVTRLVEELELSQKSAASLRATGAKALQEWHQEFVKASGQSIDDMKTLAGNLTTEGEALTTSVKAIQHSLTATGRLFASLEKRLGASSDRTAEAIEKSVESLELSVAMLVKRLEAVEIPPDIIRSKLDQVLDSIHRAVTPVADLSVKTLADLNKTVSDVARALTDFPKNEELQTSVAKLTNQLNLVADACANLKGEAEKTQGALFSITAGAATILTQLEGVDHKVADLGSAVLAVSSDAHKVNATIKEVVRFVQTSLDGRQ